MLLSFNNAEEYNQNFKLRSKQTISLNYLSHMLFLVFTNISIICIKIINLTTVIVFTVKYLHWYQYEYQRTISFIIAK